MPTNEIVEKDRGFDEFMDQMEALDDGSAGVTVGVHSKDNEPSDDEDSEIRMAKLLSIHEFGMDIEGTRYGDITIPERSVLRSTEKENRDKYKDMMKDMLPAVLLGDMRVRTMLGRVGAAAQGDVREKFGSDDLAPNAPLTVELKGSSAPLIDSGQLRQSIDYIVEDA